MSVFENLLDSEFIIAIDGGGTKTAYQVISKITEEPLKLRLNGVDAIEFIGESSNIMNVGLSGIEALIHKLFDSLVILVEIDGEITEYELQQNLHRVSVYAGLAGCTNHIPEIQQLFVTYGFLSQKIYVTSDAHAATNMFSPYFHSALLIAGTGSVCFASTPDASGQQVNTVRVGGLGRLLGDEGSGYHIGIKGIKVSLAYEFGYGRPTTLLKRLCEYFGVEPLNKIIQPIHNGSIIPAQIAGLSSYIIEEAEKSLDIPSQKIIDEAASDLGNLVSEALTLIKETRCLVYFVGGIFKQKHVETFIQKMVQNSTLKEIPQENRPLFINISNSNSIVLSLLQLLRRRRWLTDLKIPSWLYKGVSSLGTFPQANYSEYQKVFKSKNISTEEYHPSTMKLSQTFSSDRTKGILIMSELDSKVIEAAKVFNEKYLDQVVPIVSQTLHSKGRIFMIGSGSSGRVAVDIAVRVNNPNVIGIVAGDARAFIRAKEGYEDSEERGEDKMKQFQLNENDCVFLISASASAYFNLGAAKEALRVKCKIFYLHHNSKPLPELQQLFLTKQIESLFVDIGPQTITGSTRLQAASFAILAFGLIFNKVSQSQVFNETNLLNNLEEGFKKVDSQLKNIEKIISIGIDIFSSPTSNFYRSQDETKEGYITYLSGKDAIREIVIDTSETSPTFSTNPPRDTFESFKKEAEFRAYMIGNQSNSEAWKNLIGRDLEPLEINQTEQLLINTISNGYGSFVSRPKGQGNLVVGVLKEGANTSEWIPIIEDVINQGGKFCLIALFNSQDENQIQNIQVLTSKCDSCVLIQGIQDDSLGVVSSIILKKIVNLISNGVMLGMGKVLGNMMIDISPANNKLIDRSIRILQQLLSREENIEIPEREILYYMVAQTFYLRNLYQSQFGISIPPPIRVCHTMIMNKCTFPEAIDFLRTQENQTQK